MAGGTERPDSRRLRAAIRQVLPGLVPFGAVAVFWLLLTPGTNIPEIFLPPIEKMPGVVWRMFTQEGILNDVLVSCLRVLAGFLCAVSMRAATKLSGFP